MEISLTEENYIKAIFSINEMNAGAGVSTNELSEHLNNKAGSVTDMLKRLSEKKLIHYEKYKSVKLSSKGVKIALKVVRKHRLWEVFLLQKLNFKWDEVHDIAEQLEHIKSDELISRLDQFLGKPKFDPHGDPIPDENGNLFKSAAQPLSDFGMKGNFVFVGVMEHSIPFLQYLSSIGLKIGDTIRIESLNDFDKSIHVKINRKQNHFISNSISSKLLVEKKK